MKHKKNRILLFLLISSVCIILIGIRFLWLGKIPSGISDDELWYMLTTKSFFFSGQDLSQTVRLLSLIIPPGISVPFARFPSILFSAIIGPAPSSLFISRFPYAVTGILFVMVLYGIMRKLTDKKTAIITAIITLINPWNFVFFRTSFDTPIAIFFTFLTLYVLLIAKNWFILLAYPLFVAALYSYIGTSTILGIFMLPAIFYTWKYIHKSKYLLQYVLLILAISITWLLFYQSISKQNFSSRLDEILTPTSNYVTSQVNTERRLTIDTPITASFSNKVTIFSRIFLDKYFGAFSPTLLFTNGEGRTTFSLYSHGLFYYIDIIFLFIGLYFLFRFKRTLFYFFACMMLLAPIPAVFSLVGTSYTLRSSLLYPFIIMIIAVGISSIVLNKKRVNKLLISGFVSILYTVLLLNFLNIYFFKNPINNSEAFGFSGRILARYLALANKTNTDTYVIELKSSVQLFSQYIFYSNLYTSDTSDKIASLYVKDVYDWNTIHFTGCPANPYPKNTTIVIKTDMSCISYKNQEEKIILPQLSDNGSIYSIYNDVVCKNYKLDTYVHDITLKDLDVEKLTTEEFCKKYFVKPI